MSRQLVSKLFGYKIQKHSLKMKLYVLRFLVLLALSVSAPFARSRSIEGGEVEGYRNSVELSDNETVLPDGRAAMSTYATEVTYAATNENKIDMTSTGANYFNVPEETGSGFTTETAENKETTEFISNSDTAAVTVTEEDGSVYTVASEFKPTAGPSSVERRALRNEDASSEINTIHTNKILIESVANETEVATNVSNVPTNIGKGSNDTKVISQHADATTVSSNEGEGYQSREKVTTWNAETAVNGSNASDIVFSKGETRSINSKVYEIPRQNEIFVGDPKENENVSGRSSSTLETSTSDIATNPSPSTTVTSSYRESSTTDAPKENTLPPVEYTSTAASETESSSARSRLFSSPSAVTEKEASSTQQSADADVISTLPSTTLRNRITVTETTAPSVEDKVVIADLVRLLSKQVSAARDYCETSSYAQFAGTFASGLALFVSFVVTMCQLQRLLRNQRALLKSLNSPRPNNVSAPISCRPGPSSGVDASEGGNSASMPLLVRSRRVPSSPPFGRRAARLMK